MFIETLLAAGTIALLSLVGVFFFGTSGKMTGTHRYILPVAVGVFLGVVFFELVPETVEMHHELGPIAIIVGFLGFYLLSYFLRTFHHHHESDKDGCLKKDGAKLLMIGDAVHNVADGVVIATAFTINPALGVLTTIGVALHEVPQEIAEFGVLVQSGYSKSRAAFLNLLSALSIILGVLITFLFLEYFEGWLFVLTGVAAGNLLYIATADLLPELRETHKDHFWQTFLATVIGVALIGFLISYTHELLPEEALHPGSEHHDEDEHGDEDDENHDEEDDDHEEDDHDDE